MAKFIKGGFVFTARFGQRYAKKVVDAIPALKGYPWYGKCIALEAAPRPWGTVGDVIAGIPAYIFSETKQKNDGAKVLNCKVNISGHKYQGLTFSVVHLGQVDAKAKQWKSTGAHLGYVGGKYKFTGAGTGNHFAIVMKDAKGNYINPMWMWNWQRPVVAKIVEKVVEIVKPPAPIATPPTTPTSPVVVPKPVLEPKPVTEPEVVIKLEESRKYTFNKGDLKSIGKGLLIALAGALLAYLAQIATEIDFGDATPIVVALLAVLVNAGRKFLVGK